MSAPKSRPYRHFGVHLPYAQQETQWIARGAKNIVENGFIFIDALKREKVLRLQSKATGDIVINKIVKNYDFDHPSDLRFSTADAANPKLPTPRTINGVHTTPFNELIHWQLLPAGPEDEKDVFSLYYKHCNGGTLEQLMSKYQEESRQVPEHFIWHVAERLCEAILWFNFGTWPSTAPPRAAWTLLSHRDFADNNIFIHYRDKPSGRVPRGGYVTNAFPEIVVGDFGEANLATDNPPTKLNFGIFGTGVVRPWEDIYEMGKSLQELAQAHLDPDVGSAGGGFRPYSVPMDILNDYLVHNETPYTDDLIELLEEFYFTGCDHPYSDIEDTHVGPNGQHIENWRDLPTPVYIRDTMMPRIRSKVREYRFAGVVGGPPQGYFDALDVSWTKPQVLMPYVYQFPNPQAPNVVKPLIFEEDLEDTAAEMNEEALIPVTTWERLRPKHRVVALEYNWPITANVRNRPPPAPLPGPNGDGNP